MEALLYVIYFLMAQGSTSLCNVKLLPFQEGGCPNKGHDLAWGNSQSWSWVARSLESEAPPIGLHMTKLMESPPTISFMSWLGMKKQMHEKQNTYCHTTQTRCYLDFWEFLHLSSWAQHFNKGSS